MKKNSKFNFFVPLEFEKSGEDEGERVKIKGICSTDAEDSDGEVLIPSGFDFKPLLETGFLNWNHQAKNTSSAICGEPTKAEVVDDGKSLYIEGFLYPNEEGRRVADLAKTLDAYSQTRRLGFSIEGQALERDVLNPKKILRARITGVAITQSPKNPKTLLDIVKGEYDDDFDNKEEEEEEEKEGNVKKAMTANPDINPESVEGPDREEEVGSELKKSYIYNKILTRYTKDFEKADQIYSFINKVKEKYDMNLDQNITPEVLEKAFAILDKSVELSKANEQKTLDDYDKKDEVEEQFDKGEGVEEEKPSKKEPKRGSRPPKDEEDNDEEEDKDNDVEEDEDIEDEDFEKAMDAEQIAKSLLKSGMKEEEVVKAMTNVGVNKKLAIMSCLNCVDQLDEEDIQGGKVTSFSKGQVNDFEKEDIIATSSAIATILKANTEQIDSLVKSQQVLEKKVRELSRTPNARKSVVSSVGIERFEKSQQSSGESVFDSRNPNDMRRLSEVLFDEVSLIKSRGESDSALEKAVSDLEIAKSTDFARIAPRLRSLGIQVY